MVSGAGPVYDSYVPFFLKEVLEHETLVGIGMGIDNLAILLLVPVFAAWSDRSTTRFGRRVPFVVVGLFAMAVGFAALPIARSAGAPWLFAAIGAYSVATSATRAPLSALLADTIPSDFRTRANGVASVMMCVGAMPLIAASKPLYARDPRLPFLLVGAIALAVAVVYAIRLREPHERPGGSEPEFGNASAETPALRSLWRELIRDPAMPRFLAACVAFHMGFQAFSSWFTRAASATYGIPPEDCSLGFIVVGAANFVSSLPAGLAGSRFGRRNCVVFGTSGMIVACIALGFTRSLDSAIPWLAVFGSSWSLALVNLLPMALEHGGSRRAATFAGAFLVSMSLGGILGPFLCGIVFDHAAPLVTLFPMLAAFLATSLALVRSLRRGFGESSA